MGHIYEGDPPHTYNGYRSEDIQSDFGLLKLGADTIPPIVAPATMIDVAASVGKDPRQKASGSARITLRRRSTSRVLT